MLVEAYEKTDDVTDHEFILDALTSHFSEQAFPLRKLAAMIHASVAAERSIKSAAESD